MKEKAKCFLSGAAAGAANGFFGAGGGMLLIPLLTSWAKVPERKAFASSVLIILPMCVASVIVYAVRGSLDIIQAVPYLVGGLMGGIIGGKIYKKVPVKWLRRAMGLLIIYGGIRCLTG